MGVASPPTASLSVIAPLNEALGATFPRGALHVRHELPRDREFCAQLFAQTRADELAAVPWADDAKAAFCRSQFEAQHSHYRTHYADADLMVILQGDHLIGRIYVHATPSETRLMEISLLPDWRNRGIGGCLSGAVVAHAHGRGVPAGLHVEPFNPAKRLYERHGFRLVEVRGVYEFMRCEPTRTPAPGCR
ncbi:MAG: GNAT family N-acetyltransferase [Burkholderiales bacterium]|nr:GNAT family N-acetyltransferase [Burkholderiales bacterium]